MISTILIDDEPLARAIIREYAEAFPQLTIVQECNDGFEGLKAIMQHKPQLIFLDVQMPKINGFEMLELIEEPPAVIFVTAFDEYAIKAFESHAIDYLLKPFSRERFNKAIEKFLEQSENSAPPAQSIPDSISLSPQQRQRVVVKTGGKIKIIPTDDIHYFEAADDYVRIHTKEGGFLKNRTMAHLKNHLMQMFFVRTHRSFIVNVQQITRIDPYEKESWIAILKNGTQVSVSKSGHARLKQVLVCDLDL
jgi:two-component system LytT family response regulator